MAWIESHSNLEKHHKLIRFQAAMRWSRNEAVGFLHRFWWSVLEVSPSGDVTALTSPEVMSETLNMKPEVVEDAVLKMEECGFLEREGMRLYATNWDKYSWRVIEEMEKQERQRIQSNVRVKEWRATRRNATCNATCNAEPSVTPLPLPPTPPNPNPKNNTSPGFLKTKKPGETPVALPAQTSEPTNGNGTSPPKNGPGRQKTDVQLVVSGFKAVLGVPDDDRGWDRVYFRRYSRPASELLALFGGDVDRVAQCIDGVSAAMEKRRLSWTPETIVKHAGDWKNGRLFE